MANSRLPFFSYFWYSQTNITIFKQQLKAKNINLVSSGIQTHDLSIISLLF